MTQSSCEKGQKQQRIKRIENILLKGSITEGVRNYDQKSPGTGQFVANVSTPPIRRQLFDAWSVLRELVSKQGQFDAFFFRTFMYF